MSGLSETELIQRLKKGDRDAFNEIVTIHQNKVVNIAYGMLSSREDALDAAQETFLKVYNGIDAFKGGSSISTWIYRICTNVCTDMLRKRQRSATIISIDREDDENSPIHEIADDSPTPDNSVIMNEQQKAVRHAISQLSDEYRTVLTLCDIEGLSYEEISAVLKCPVGTIKSRLSRARNNLKKILLENRELFL